MLRETVARRFRGSGFEVVKVAVHYLIIAQTLSHVVQYVLAELLRLGIGKIFAHPVGVQTGFVHSHKPYRREMVVESGKITLGVREQTVVEKLGDHLTLDVQRTRRKIHHLVESRIEIPFVFRKISDTRHIDGHHADTARRFAGAEEAARFFTQFAEVEPQTATHTSYVARLHVGVDVVGEIRRAVLRGHLEQKFVVLGLGPVEFLRYRIGRYRILEAPAVGVALDHRLDEGFIDHIHFLLAVLVFEVLLHAAHYRVELGKVVRNGPVEGYVAERRLRAPAARNIHAVYEALYRLLHFVIAQFIRFYEGREIGVEGAERLRARPFVLHYAEEVHHLVAKSGKVLGGRGGYLARNAAQTLFDELTERPARAVTGEHRKIVKMYVRPAVRVGYLLVVNFAEPVVGGYRAGVGEDESAHRISDGAVLLHAPVVDLEVVVDDLFVVEERAFDVTRFFALLSVENVRLGDVGVTRLYEHRLDAVLNVLDGYFLVLDFGAEIRGHAKREKLERASVIQLVEGIERLGNGVDYFVDVELDDLVVSVNYLIHGILRSKKFRTQLLYYSVRKMSTPFYNILWSILAKYYRRTQYIVAG